MSTLPAPPASVFPDTCSISRVTGAGAYGPIYATAADLSCHWQPGSAMVVDANGTDTLASGMLYLPAAAEIAAGDKVTVDGSTYAVIAANAMRAGGAIHHWECALRSLPG